MPAALQVNCATPAAQCLVDRLNAQVGAPVWDWVRPPILKSTDAIANGILYKPASVKLVGTCTALYYTNPEQKVCSDRKNTLMYVIVYLVHISVFAHLCSELSCRKPGRA